jgi:MSHA biogenesis protein MshL
MRFVHALLCLGCLTLLASCGVKPIKPAAQHLDRNDAGVALGRDIPPPVKNVLPLQPPKPAAKVETYSVVVTNLPAQEILFAMARDAKINIDIYPGIQGNVTLNAINQTLPQILDRIAKQIDMRYELNNGNLIVEPDKAYLKTYKVDFINMSRSVDNTINTSSQISPAGTGGATVAASGGNSATTKITSSTKNDLMESLVQNVRDIILDEDKLHFQEKAELQHANQVSSRGAGYASDSTTASKGGAVQGGAVVGSGDQNAQGQGSVTATKGVYERAVNVFANKETGVLIVRATSRQHAKVQEFIDKVMNTAKKQVLIEATIAEVTLSSNYQQGINWSHVFPGRKGIQLAQTGTGTLTAANTGTMLTLKNANMSANISLLESFGDVKVLSSPKLSVMNNQTATLKVVDNKVYFVVSGSVTPATTTTPMISNFTSTSNTVADSVTMNVRPTISRITGYANDPNPSLASPCGNISGTISGINLLVPDSCKPIVNKIPEIQTREMESIIKINSGQIAVLGGLMQDEANRQSDGIPILSDIPILGNLFKYRNDSTKKTELVIFIRPTVVKSASVDEDYGEFRNSLPDADFLAPSKTMSAHPEQ